MPPMIDLSIVIVSYNTRDLLAACLDSIQRGLADTPLRAEVIVVDSASSDGTPALLAERYAWVRSLPQTTNVGYTRGNNIGLAAATGRYLFLLNPDTEIVADALPALCAYLDANPQIGIVGPHTLNTDGSTQSSKRRFPTPLTGLFESTWLQPLAPKALMRRFYAEDVPDRGVAEVDWVQGSALLARREVYEKIGGLDEGYVMFSEELDWCRRAKEAGFRVAYYGLAQIVHHGGRSTEQVGARKHIWFQQSKIRYFRKHHGAVTAALIRLVLVANYMWQLGLESAKWLVGSRRALRRDRMRTYWQVIRALTGGKGA